ncbi:hypothetical protein [Bifidobacterium crudilactis]|uniref:hypothetical protein n=1 Tax=Bifidobacterium crudilactis TaxID=327277 RepID=UPI002353DAA5|nr:hypothetical protein [Bifidobacterium crudilactis]MCI1217177.1 hypothetical protein [Bifidobacterium crudilactis]
MVVVNAAWASAKAFQIHSWWQEIVNSVLSVGIMEVAIMLAGTSGKKVVEAGWGSRRLRSEICWTYPSSAEQEIPMSSE